MKKLFAALLLSFCSLFASAQTPTPTTCGPAADTDIRSGTVGNDIWFYWWCRNPTSVWLTWNGYLESELKKSVFEGTIQFQSQLRRGETVGLASDDTLRGKPWNTLLSWQKPPVDRPDTAHLKAAVLAAAAAETTTRPIPGEPFVGPLTLGDLWNVTPNGASPTRKTNLLDKGLVTSTYGQSVKILTPCDCTTLKFAEGSMTQKCPLASATLDLAAVTEVISCIRLPR